MTKEEIRLVECQRREKHWKRWGPYLSERAWGLGRLIFQKGFGEENSGAVNPQDRQRRSLLSISARRRSNCAVSATSLFVITGRTFPSGLPSLECMEISLLTGWQIR